MITDDGLIWERISKRNVLSIENIEKDVVSEQKENSLVNFKILASDREFIIRRTYSRIQSVMADVMGLYSYVNRSKMN